MDRKGGRAETGRYGMGLVPFPYVVDINWGDISGVRHPSPTPDQPAQGSSARS